MLKVTGLCFAMLIFSGVAQAEKPRDPFIAMQADRVGGPTRVVQPSETANKKPPVAPTVAKKPVEAPPAVAMQGLVQSATGSRAILKTEKHTFIVAQGDRVGDYTVAQVRPEGVTLKHKDQSFLIKFAHI